MSISMTFARQTHGADKERGTMNAYSTLRNTSYATIVVAALAGIVSNALAVDQRIIYERDVPEAAAVTVLPEVVVTASRLEW
jgi:hypothetical protein